MAGVINLFEWGSYRLAGATLIAPVVNYWWPGFPANLSKEAYSLKLPQDQWMLRIAHYTPCLTYWWNKQKLFPASAVVARRPEVFSPKDLELLPLVAKQKSKVLFSVTLKLMLFRRLFSEGLTMIYMQLEILQQGEFESLHRDMMIGFGKWEFDPMDLDSPFPNDEGSIHLWNGEEDRMVPVSLQRYIAQKLPWIHYHEVPGAGHLLPYVPGVSEAILKALLLAGK